MRLDDYDDAARARRVSEQPKAGQVTRDEFVRDRARVLHSAALRRLAARTQVVGVGESDFPRTRLTHSLECAQIGRELAGALGADPDLVDAACLAHDLGHPPFGHNGETALAAYAADIGGFEGNAQSLRVLTRLEAKVIAPDGISAGLNLTRAALDAATKYPWPSTDGTPKFGVYDDDRPVFDWLRDGAPDRRRCIEAQIMDWADDVAYSVHDLEDGVQAGHVKLEVIDDAVECDALVALARESYSDAPADELAAALDRLRDSGVWLREFDGSLRALVALKRMTSELIARLCGAALDATRAAAPTAQLRRYGGDLAVPADIRAECAVLKAVADRYVMRRETTVRAQARQREQLTELLDALSAQAPQMLEPWLRPAYDAARDDEARTRVVIDQVASLTDVSAMVWHARLVR
ncbi:MAG TPA: deoxyguanosinetriphosphate triphosphohydrolase [Mycobacteriales bacterium]|nr:deoxyguanosinetriphosphate triphosphohydrolase [Mycobacteriales bacterium]